MMFDLDNYYEGTEEEHLKELEEYSYDLIKWRDHIPEFGDTKREILVTTDLEGNEIVRHERYDGDIFQQGTPVDAENLGYMDYSLYLAWLEVKRINGKISVIGDMQDDIADIYDRLGKLENAVFSDITGNPFHISFENLDGLIVTGVWNKEKQRIEI